MGGAASPNPSAYEYNPLSEEDYVKKYKVKSVNTATGKITDWQGNEIDKKTDTRMN